MEMSQEQIWTIAGNVLVVASYLFTIGAITYLILRDLVAKRKNNHKEEDNERKHKN